MQSPTKYYHETNRRRQGHPHQKLRTSDFRKFCRQYFHQVKQIVENRTHRLPVGRFINGRARYQPCVYRGFHSVGFGQELREICHYYRHDNTAYQQLVTVAVQKT